MSEQIQYNYYNTVTTKTGDNSFIFRGKRNMPNLVLQNGDSYISTKLTIRADDGTVEIEHEPITNYSKRVIATFPIPLYIDIKIGESKEINLNSIIPKSLRFDADESGDVIFLHPATSSVGSVEGFCNSAKCTALQKAIDAANARITKQESRSGGNLTDADYAAMAARIAAMNGAGGLLGGADDGGELVCTPITDYEDNEMTLVGVTNALSELDQLAAAENSIYHQSAINVIIFIGGFLLLSKAISGLYEYGVNRLRNPSLLSGFEFIFVMVFLGVSLTLYLAGVKYAQKGETAEQTKLREKQNLTITYVVIGLIIFFIFVLYVVFDHRKKFIKEAMDNGNELDKAAIMGHWGVRKSGFVVGAVDFISKGMSGTVAIYRRYFTT